MDEEYLQGLFSRCLGHGERFTTRITAGPAGVTLRRLPAGPTKLLTKVTLRYYPNLLRIIEEGSEDGGPTTTEQWNVTEDIANRTLCGFLGARTASEYLVSY